eukprot:TRINITY_DN1072_c0_g1_i5.p2 TRINITY_DN1072_c0_g1~~TRINITY_DN1072_c0_g1_i5.p2  ORF type:complete len:133 (-),score=20.64 TRINITY_DN1072_c0_g1_i5:996-1394(-)
MDMMYLNDSESGSQIADSINGLILEDHEPKYVSSPISERHHHEAPSSISSPIMRVSRSPGNTNLFSGTNFNSDNIWAPPTPEVEPSNMSNSWGASFFSLDLSNNQRNSSPVSYRSTLFNSPTLNSRKNHVFI